MLSTRVLVRPESNSLPPARQPGAHYLPQGIPVLNQLMPPCATIQNPLKIKDLSLTSLIVADTRNQIVHGSLAENKQDARNKRPVPNVVLLPCRTQMNLAWQWHDDGTAAVSNIEPNTVAPNSKDKTNHPSSVIV